MHSFAFSSCITITNIIVIITNGIIVIDIIIDDVYVLLC